MKKTGIMFTLILFVWAFRLGAQEQECYDLAQDNQCPTNPAPQGGGCFSFPSLPLVNTNNVDSTNPYCQSVSGSYCIGYDMDDCGSVCASTNTPTGLQSNGYNVTQVTESTYTASFWCGDYTETIPGYNGPPIEVTCGPICIGDQDSSEQTVTISDCNLTQSGCASDDDGD